MEFITYLLNPDGSIFQEHRGLTSSSKDRSFLTAKVGNRILYPGFSPDSWREVKKSGFDGTTVINIPISKLPDTLKVLLPKEVQIQLLIGAI